MFEKPEQAGIPWRRLLDVLPQIKLDVHETYGVDLDAPGVAANTSWHWFSAKISGLLSAPIRAYRPDGYPLPPNRLARELFPIPAPKTR